MSRNWYLVLWGFACLGCDGSAPLQIQARPNNSAPTALPPTSTSLAKPSDPPPAELRPTETELNLPDLRLVLRKVTFDRPIDGRNALFFAETEVTNEMYALFLRRSHLSRNDAPIWKAEQQRRTVKTTVTENADGSVTYSSQLPPFSTGDPVIDATDSSGLWMNGAFPEDRADHPVSFVSIIDATDFCRWLNYRYRTHGAFHAPTHDAFRLPTEEEWLMAAYGDRRQYPWGNEELSCRSESTEPVHSHPEWRTPEGLFAMWGNVSEFVTSPSNGYGGQTGNKYVPIISQWLGASYRDRQLQPRQDYWGYTHNTGSRSDSRGFRVVYVPEN